MIRHTAPLLLLSLAFASVVACIPPFFTPTTTGNTNATAPGFLLPGPFGFLIPFNPVTNSGGHVPATVNGSGFVANINVETPSPNQTPGFNQNGTFNLNFNNTFNLNFDGTFNFNDSISPVVNQNLTP